MSLKSEKQLLKNIHAWILIFIIGLVLSGITAFPIEKELAFTVNHIKCFPGFMHDWIQQAYAAIKTTNENFPFISYGTDWLAFAHIAIAVAFIGPYRNPVKNKWVVQFGMIACILVIPLALIAGPIRGIPFYWRMIDCSFGVVGIIPLYICYRKIISLENLLQK